MPASSTLPITSLPAIGTYGYMVLLISNALQLQHSEVFSASVTGKGGTAGKFCATNSAVTSFSQTKTSGVLGNPVTPELSESSTLGMTCGSSAPTPAFTTEYMDDFADNPGSDPFAANTSASISLTGGSMMGRLMQVDNTTTATSANNSERLAVVFTFTTPQSVTSESQYNLNFKIQDSVAISLSYSGGTIFSTKSGANPFQIYMDISN